MKNLNRYYSVFKIGVNKIKPWYARVDRILILGHSSNDITESAYTHKTLEQLVEAIDKI